jgi:hypothetical protein
MPIQSCTLPNGKKGYKWGKSGKCYASRASAEQQKAIGYEKSGRNSKRNKKTSTI